MNRAAAGWTVVMLLGALGLIYRAAFTPHGMGKVYVKPVPAAEQSDQVRWISAKPADAGAVVSVPRSIGLWLAALFTLAIFSFLYRDNVGYRLAESIFVGTTAGWLMAAVGFWDGIVDKLLVNLIPGLIRASVMPDLSPERHAGTNWVYFVPLALGIMLLWRLAPRGGWISRWPMALVVGTFAGLKLVSFLEADFVSQIRSSIVPLVAFTSGQFDLWQSVRNVGLIVGLLACLSYFFFSVEHKGVMGISARLGIWFLMMTFGASFAYTVMGRIALLAGRVEFLLNDWLWLIDPTHKRPW